MKVFRNNDIDYIVGKNSKENWKILENADDEDIWIHLHDCSSPYIIIKTYKTLDNNDLLYGGFICKQNSKYKNKNNLKMVFSSVKHVKKGKCIGEVILLEAPNILKIPNSISSI
jgi:predicted ribosome quality control (RQC) complex YloA/Tae2 family protein